MILNLKPAKLAGHASEAMILASEQTGAQSAQSFLCFFSLCERRTWHRRRRGQLTRRAPSCAHRAAPESPEGKIVKLLSPPAGAAPGSRVFLKGGAANDAPPKECKSSVWAQVKEGLRVQGGRATYGGTVLVSAEGEVAAEAVDGSHIG